MADKGWTAQVAAAAGMAAGMSAAQLGVGYGLGIVAWSAPAGGDAWTGGLGWATWIAASSTVLGAVVAHRLPGAAAPTSPRRAGAAWRFALALAAAVGALLAVALIAVPVRVATQLPTFVPLTVGGWSPVVTAAAYAVCGVLLGLCVAFWAVSSRPVAANLVLTAGWLWTLAVAGVVHGLTSGSAAVSSRLGGWQFTGRPAGWHVGLVSVPGAGLALGAALVLGAAAAWPAARRGRHGLSAALSGAVGPLLVAASYLLLTPLLALDRADLASAYLVAPYAVLAGLTGSAVVVAAAQRSARRRVDRTARTAGSAAVAHPLGSAAVAEPVGSAGQPVGSTAAAQPVGSTAAAQPIRSGGGAADPPPKEAESAAAGVGRATLPQARAGNDAPAPSGEPDRGTAARSGPGGSKTGGSGALGSAALGAAGRQPRAESAAPARSTVAPPPAQPTVAQINPTPAPPKASNTRRAAQPAKGTPAAGKAGNPEAAAAKAAPRRRTSATSAAAEAPAASTSPLWIADDPGASGGPEDDHDGVRNRLRRFGRRANPDAADSDTGADG